MITVLQENTTQGGSQDPLRSQSEQLLYRVLPQVRADDAEPCKTIEGAVAQLVENGTYAEIAAKYPDIQNNLTLLG